MVEKLAGMRESEKEMLGKLKEIDEQIAWFSTKNQYKEQNDKGYDRNANKGKLQAVGVYVKLHQLKAMIQTITLMRTLQENMLKEGYYTDDYEDRLNDFSKDRSKKSDALKRAIR